MGTRAAGWVGRLRNLSINTRVFFQAGPAVWGPLKFDAFSTKFTGCAYMNPEYEESELEKALQWAIWSTETTSPSCVLAVYPRWSKA
eukprot:869229-Prorocentrum_minimum.AAC.1